MSLTLIASQKLNIPNVLFWTASACGFMGYLQYRSLIEKCLFPLKDTSYLTNEYLNTVIDWIPGMEGIKLKHLPSFIRTTDADDLMVNFAKGKVENARDASALLFDTIDDLEHEALEALSPTYPPIFAIDTKEPNSVVYVNFGSVTVMTDEQLVEFASDLANSKMRILWVMRPDLIIGESPLSLRILFSKPRKGAITRSEFLTHCGWNSTMESLCWGVQMLPAILL
ncbi:hypothetical protein ACOSP7_014870 [Xanthoceras sorbifolium]